MNIKLTYKEIHKLIDLGIDIKVDTPFGLKSIREKFIKDDVGYILSYNDNTETKCAVSHNILMENDLKSVSDIMIGDKTSTGKIVVSKRAVPLQSWYDFEINHRSGFYYQNGVVHHNSGKSLTIALMAEFFRQNNMKGILLVPNINLLTQFKNDIKDYNLIDLYEDTHVIGGGQTERHFNNSLTISTWQSLQDLSMVNLDELDYVICDECLHPDTLITTIEGDKKIIDIKPGDIVLTINEETKEREWKKVIKRHKNLGISRNEKMLNIKMEDGRELKITGNHKVQTQRGWVRADELTVDDDIISL